MIEFLYNLRLSVFSWAISRSNPSNIDKLDPEFEINANLRRHALLRSWIKPKLEKMPYWKNGLYQYGVSSLELRDIHAAFYCGKALLELGVKRLGENLLIRVYLAAGEGEKALVISRSSEDIAASKLLIGDNSDIICSLKQ